MALFCDLSQSPISRQIAISAFVDNPHMSVDRKADVLLECLSQRSEPEIKTLIVTALGSIKESDVTLKLRSLLSDPHVGLSAVISLAKHRDETVLVECARLLKLGVRERHIAIVSLSILGTERAITVLGKEYASEKSSVVRLSLALAMALNACNIGEPDLVSELQRAIRSGSGEPLAIQHIPVLCGLCHLENRDALLTLEGLVLSHSDWCPELRLIQMQLKDRVTEEVGDSFERWKGCLLQWVQARIRESGAP